MRRREFLSKAGMAAGLPLLQRAKLFAQANAAMPGHHLPLTDSHYRITKDYIEETPIPEYHWASEQAYEAFRDLKYGIRIHWGIYSAAHFEHESWPFLDLDFAARAQYNDIYKTWNPVGFDADEWTNLFVESGLKMFAFTTKHHEGFSMFDSKTRVRKRVKWDAPGGPQLEDCDLAYSIMETPFRRDVVRELTQAAHKRGLHISLYYSHPDWYDADFRPYASNPTEVVDSGKYDTQWRPHKTPNPKIWVAPDPTPAEEARMMARHRAQLTELLTNYGEINMLSLDQWLGPRVWPQLRQTLLELRRIQPNVMLRARGIGNYGDYYTPEGFVPGSKSNTDFPWMVIYPLGGGFSYDPNAAHYKGAAWIVKNIVDTAAKGGSFQVGVGPDGMGRFHPTAVEQLREAGKWMHVCGEGIYATRARDGDLWHEGDGVRYTRSKDHRTVNAFLMSWPGREVVLKSVRPRDGSAVRMYGYPQNLPWSYDAATGLHVRLPEAMDDAAKRPTQNIWGLKIEV